MNKIACARCRHDNEIGARICDSCGKALAAPAIRRALGNNPVSWLRATAIGQMVPFALLALLLVGGYALGPSALGWRQLILEFGLVGIVTLGVTFPLLKGHYDFAAGPLAGLAACCAAMVSPHGALWAVVAALGVGCLAGVINGLVVGWTRLSSTMVTIITALVALQLTIQYTARADLVVTNPLMISLAETNVLHVPVILSLFVVALLLARVLLNQPTFWPVGQAPSRSEAAARTTAPKVFASFVVSGLMAGIAGLLIASAGLTAMGMSGQLLWVLTPVAAALIGGASVAAGTGNLRTVAVGAAVIATTNWLCTQLRMAIAGPIVETPYLALGLLGDRWKDMTWYMIRQARIGNLLALPDELRLPMLVGSWRRTHWSVRVLALLGVLAVSGAAYVYVVSSVLRKVPEGTAKVAQLRGDVEVVRYGTLQPAALQLGSPLYPGDQVTAGKDGEAMLRLHDGTELKVQPSTEMAIEELSASTSGATTTRLSLAVGGFFAKVRKLVNRESAFTVETPVLTLGVRGTAFQVAVGQEEGQVAVGEGQVEVTRELQLSDAKTGRSDKFTDAHQVAAGQGVTAEKSLHAAEVRALSGTEMYNLQQSADELTAENHRTLMRAMRSRSLPYFWGFVALAYVWFFFIVCRPMPHEYIAEVMRRKAQAFEKIHNPTPADSPNLVALAQMNLLAGDYKKAQESLETVIQHDPNSDYGQWARRLYAELKRRRGGIL